MTLKKYIAATALAISSVSAYAQVGIGTATPDASAQLQIDATDKGILIPRIYKINRPVTPATGLMIYQLDDSPGFYFYNGTAWEKVGGGFNHELSQTLRTKGQLISGSDFGSDGLLMRDEGTMIVKGNSFNFNDLTETGEGYKMIWHPRKGSFRAGYTAATTWDNDSTGYFSIGLGYNPAATGYGAVAIGNESKARGAASFALGSYAIADGNSAYAIGNSANTNGHYNSFAIGANAVNDADNQLKMSFNGGIKFEVDNFFNRGLSISPTGVMRYNTDVSWQPEFDDRALVDKGYMNQTLNAGLRYMGKLQVDVGSSGGIPPLTPDTWHDLTWESPYMDYENSLQADGKTIIIPPGITKIRITARVTVYPFELSAATVADQGTVEIINSTMPFSSQRVSTTQRFLLFNGWNFSSPILDVAPGDAISMRIRHDGDTNRTLGWGSDNNTYLVIEYYK